MPRPRFAKLEEHKQAKILEIAASEFAESGFDGASYNRIIERAGLSKGAMYYYFDDKTDLYVTVLRDALTRMMAAVMDGFDPEAGYWARLEHMLRQSVTFTREHAEFGALARGFLAASDRLRAGGVLEELYAEQRAMTEQIIAEGQALGEVRTDLPMPLLVSVTFAMGEAIDRWWLEHLDELTDEAETKRWAKELVDLFRRVAEPRGDDK